MFDSIIKMAKNATRIDVIKKHPDFNKLLNETNFLPENANLWQRIWHVKNNTNIIPLCKHCNKVEVNWRKKEYVKFCSMKCLSNNKSVLEQRTATMIERHGVDNPMKLNKFKEKSKQTNMNKLGFAHASQSPEIIAKRNETNLKKYGNICSLHGKETSEKTKQTNIDKRGVEFASQSQEFKEKVRQTNIKNIGVECIFQLESTKEKLKQSNKKKYNVEFASQSPEVQEKIKQTNREKFGTDWASQSPEIKEKVRQTNIKNLGVKYPLQSPEIFDKMVQTNLKRYGVKNTFQVPEFKEKIIQTNINLYGVEHAAQQHISSNSLSKLNDKEWLMNQHVNKKKPMETIAKELNVNGTTIANYFKKYNIEVKYFFQSQPEKEIIEFIKKHTNTIILENKRNIIAPQELDIYLPELKFAIEFNGTYWHSELNGKDRNYHLNKLNKCEEKGIELMYIWEHDWHSSKNIILSLILFKLGKISNKLDARKCIVKEISKSISKDFLLDNHLHGSIPSELSFGLYHNSELISVMAFTPNRFSDKQQYEMTRFASKKYVNIRGGASKLFSYFLNKYNPLSVVTYAERGLFKGNSYKSLNFVFSHISSPNHHYIKNNKVHSRLAFQKHKLHDKLENYDPNLSAWQNMINNGYDRIWNCGNNVYIYENPQK